MGIIFVSVNFGAFAYILCDTAYMHHVAIMKKQWKLLEKIVSGKKTIESRWYKHRCEAWGKVRASDTVFFKNSGEPITVRARVHKVIEFSDLTFLEVKKILKKYGGPDGIGSDDLNYFYHWAKDKKYCVLVFLQNYRRVQPFHINKKGFGSARAWLTMRNINAIRI